MVWEIRGITLPIDPREIRKKTMRIQQPIPVSGDYPDPSLNQPAKFELSIKGKIWPRQLAKQLDEAMSNPESEDMFIEVSDEPVGDQWITGIYSVEKSEINRIKPTYEATTGGEVYEYNITFVKFADTGTDQSADQAGATEDEDTGFFDFQALGFDANGDGDIDIDDIFNWFNSIMTFGATG
jgi:hypothetical protein